MRLVQESGAIAAAYAEAEALVARARGALDLLPAASSATRWTHWRCTSPAATTKAFGEL